MNNKEKCLILFALIMLILFIISVISNYSIASSPIDDPDSYRPGDITAHDASALTDRAKPVINAISIFGMIVAVITLIVLGIKYMIGSVDEKAEYKKTMTSYIIGVIFIIGIVTILQFINNFVFPILG